MPSRRLLVCCVFAVLASAQVLAQTFAPAVPYGSGGNGPNAVAMADVNGDGIPDLIVANWCTNSGCTASSVGVLLGNGDGTFKTAVAYPSGGLYADSVAVGDFNGDGKPDIVVGNCGYPKITTCDLASNGNVAVLLNTGNGTFASAVPYSLGTNIGAASVAVADLGNGTLDLIVAAGSATGSTVDVLVGNGDGTFKSAVPYNSGGFTALSVTVADVNGDNKPDLVVANWCTDNTCVASSVGVLLGKGDGTFDAAVAYDSGGFLANSVAIGDVNGDGKPDVVVGNANTSTTVSAGNVGVLLGNGDGTFQTAVPYSRAGVGATSVVISDVNGDGKLDLAVANCGTTGMGCGHADGDLVTLLGNGDGTFQAPVSHGSGGNSPFGLAVGDVNGDGRPDLVAANCVSNQCGSGAGELGVLLNTSLTTTATGLTSSLNPSALGDAVTFTATVTGNPAFYKGTPTGTVTFKDGTTALGSPVALNSSGVATLATSTLAVGTHGITAVYSGDTHFTISTSPALQQVVQGAATTTGLSISPGSVAVGGKVTLTATVASGKNVPPNGETVTFESGSAKLGTGTLSNGTATLTSTTIPAGVYSLVASYPGDSNFGASTSSPQTLNVQDFSIVPNPTTVTVSAPGQSGTTTITIKTEGNLSASSVTFACSGLPAASQCSFGSVNSNDEVTLTISTAAPTSSGLHWPRFGHYQELLYATLLPGFLGMVSISGRKRTLRIMRLLSLSLVLGLVGLWVACGGGSTSGAGAGGKGGTPTGSSTIAVNATSGSLQHSTSITLSVQ
jgi:hypothetical protein